MGDAMIRTRRGRLGWRGVLYATVLAVGLLSTFVLPWYVDLGDQPVVGDSYVIGFDNTTAILAVLATALALAALGLRARTETDSTTGLWLTATGREERTSRPLVLVIAGLTVAACAWLAYAGWGQWQWPGDARYFIDRMLEALNGGAHFRDLGFGYGPALLYVPLALYWSIRPLGGSIETAYWITFVFAQLLGVLVAAFVTDHLDLTRKARAAVFLLLTVPLMFNWTLGVNHSLLRFLAPLAVVLVFHRRMAGRDATGPWLATVTAAALALACAAISPDAGIAAFAGLGAYLVCLGVRRRGRWLIGLALFAPLPLLWSAAFGGTALDRASAVLAGAWNLPVLAGPAVIGLLIAMFASATLLPGMVAASHYSDRPATIAAWAAAIVMALPAFARPDSLHVFLCGACVTVVALSLLAGSSRRLFAGYLTALLIVSMLGSWLMFRYGSAGPLVEHLVSSRAVSGAGKAAVIAVLGPPSQTPWDPYQPYASDRLTYDTGLIMGLEDVAPLPAFRDPVGVKLAERGRLRSPYVYDAAPTASQLTRQKRQLASASYVLVASELAALAYGPEGAPTTTDLGGTLSLYFEDGRRRMLGADTYSWSLMYPAEFPYVRAPFDPTAGLLETARPLFHPIAAVGPYVVLENNQP
jgi:hypothetical protein